MSCFDKGEKMAQTGSEAIESAPLDELRALQLERLRCSLGHAYKNVAHYRSAFDAAGVHPNDLNAIEDLGRFPRKAQRISQRPTEGD